MTMTDVDVREISVELKRQTIIIIVIDYYDYYHDLYHWNFNYYNRVRHENLHYYNVKIPFFFYFLEENVYRARGDQSEKERRDLDC